MACQNSSAMKKLFFLIFLFVLHYNLLFSQVGINSNCSQPDSSAMLDVNSDSRGVLIPRMSQVKISLITRPANGLVVFCTTDDKFYAYIASDSLWKEILFGTGTIEPLTLPVVTTNAVINIKDTSATSGGDVTSDGGYTVTARGVCWSTASNPTISDSHTCDGSGTGEFMSNLTGLSDTTLYYVRAYATNSSGTIYGDELAFATFQDPLKKGLVAYYPFDGNAHDESGLGKDGTVFNATLI